MLLRAGPCGRSALAHFALPTHRTRRDGLVYPAVRAASRRARREGYAPVPSRRAVQRHRPPSWFQRFQNLPLQWQRREAAGPLGQSRNHRNEQATNLPPMCYPRWRDWRVPAALDCMARSRRQGSVLADDRSKRGFAWSAARTSTVDRAPFARGRASRKARAESALWFRRNLWLMLSRMASFHTTPRATGPKSFLSKHRDSQLCPSHSHGVQ